MRGRITDEIKVLAKELLDIDELSTAELRLMPYIQYQMMNEQRIDPNKINQDERRILQTWRENGWIEGGASGLSISKEFWDAINQLLWVGYVTG